LGTPNGRAFSGEPSERSERPERMRGRRARCNAILGGVHLEIDEHVDADGRMQQGRDKEP